MKISIIVDEKLTYLDDYIKIGINSFEITLNEDPTYFMENFEKIKSEIDERNIQIASIGQWGSLKIVDQEINREQLLIDKELIRRCNSLGASKFVTGCNFDENLSEEENINIAINYFKELVEFGRELEVDVCIYNCDWNNYVYNEKYWSLLVDNVSGLMIKYDPSHSYYRDYDYLEELSKRVDSIGHFHVKGGMKIKNERYDDPPAFMDQIDWNSIFSILNIKEYQHYVSIEPHSLNMTKEKMLNGVNYTYKKLIDIIL